MPFLPHRPRGRASATTAVTLVPFWITTSLPTDTSSATRSRTQSPARAVFDDRSWSSSSRTWRPAGTSTLAATDRAAAQAAANTPRKRREAMSLIQTFAEAHPLRRMRAGRVA